MKHTIMIDGRNFRAGKSHETYDFLENLLLALREKRPDWRLTVAMYKSHVLPASLDGKVTELYLPPFTELFWPVLIKGKDLFLTSSATLPWRKLSCPSMIVTDDHAGHEKNWHGHIEAMQALMEKQH